MSDWVTEKLKDPEFKRHFDEEMAREYPDSIPHYRWYRGRIVFASDIVCNTKDNKIRKKRWYRRLNSKWNKGLSRVCRPFEGNPSYDLEESQVVL